MSNLTSEPLQNQAVASSTPQPDYGPEYFRMPLSHDMIVWALSTICHSGIVEIRCVGVDGHSKRIDSGYFNDFQRAAEAVQQYVNDGSTRGVYFSLNPISPELMEKAFNRMEHWARTTTADADILCRKWLFMDFDAVRPSDISATEEQVNQARERAITVARWLVRLGFCRPILVMSGNGAHLYFPISLPNDLDSHALVSNVLRTLDLYFSDDNVKVDRRVSNAARLCRLPGTIARKGDATSDRPHRAARLELVPGYLAYRSGEYCITEVLQTVAALSEPTTMVRSLTASTSSSSRLMVPEYLRSAGIEFVEKASKDGEFTRYRLAKCPFNNDHKSPDAMVFQLKNGATGFKCLHDSCSEHHWAEFKTMVGKPKPEHYNPPKQPICQQ